MASSNSGEGSKEDKNHKPQLSLEFKARAILEDNIRPVWEPSPLATILRDLRLALKQVEESKQLSEKIDKSITRSECQVGSELLKVNARSPEYSTNSHNERAALQGQLLALQSERRRLLLSKHEQSRQLNDRLLTILNRYHHLVGNHED